MKPILKPGKTGATHNEYRKLSLMSVIRKRLEKVGSLMMRPYWSAGDYQAGFRKGKRAASRIFIFTCYGVSGALAFGHVARLMLTGMWPFAG